MLYIKKPQMQSVMQKALENAGCDETRARRLARIITESTMDGSTTHGANRFPRLVTEVKFGVISLEGTWEKILDLAAAEC